MYHVSFITAHNTLKKGWIESFSEHLSYGSVRVLLFFSLLSTFSDFLSPPNRKERTNWFFFLIVTALLSAYHRSRIEQCLLEELQIFHSLPPVQSTAWCSEIGSLTSLDAPELHTSVTSENQFHCTRLYNWFKLVLVFRTLVVMKLIIVTLGEYLF